MSCKSLGSGGVRLRLLAREMGKRTTMKESTSLAPAAGVKPALLWQALPEREGKMKATNGSDPATVTTRRTRASAYSLRIGVRPSSSQSRSDDPSGEASGHPSAGRHCSEADAKAPPL